MTGPTHVPLAYNNVYFLETGTGGVLIDTGPDYKGAWDALQEALPRRPSVVLATHGHHDHAGLGARWQQAGVPVALHAADAHLPARPPLHGEGELAAFETFVRESGAPARVVEAAVAGLRARQRQVARERDEAAYAPAGRGGRWPTALRYAPFAPAIVLEGQDDLTLGEVSIVPCPGHTPGNVVAVYEPEGWLFSGDQLLPDITPTPGIQPAPGGRGRHWRFPSLPAYVASLERLGRRSFSRCYPGHGAPFAHVSGAIAANLAAIEQRTERVAAALRASGRASLYALAETLYPRALERRYWQIIATVQGHLDLLEAAGRAHLVEGRWQLT